MRIVAATMRERIITDRPTIASLRVRTDTLGLGVGINKPPKGQARCTSGRPGYKIQNQRIGVEKATELLRKDPYAKSDTGSRNTDAPAFANAIATLPVTN